MFSIKPACPSDYYDIKELYEKYGKALELTKNRYIMVAREEEISGIGIYSISENTAYFEDILMKDDNNIQMKYFITKAVLNSVDLKGIKEVCSAPSVGEKVLKLCKFQEKDGRYCLNLEGYFESGCGE